MLAMLPSWIGLKKMLFLGKKAKILWKNREKWESICSIHICWYIGIKFCKLVGWLVVLRINVDLAIFQPYLELEAGDNQSLKIQVARPGIEPRSSCSAVQELNPSATTAPCKLVVHILNKDLSYNSKLNESKI